jgi:ribulose-5-phosphate 4-epimerase/fuculose-1-phosphate aldolase
MIDEGVIKFNCHWNESDFVTETDISELLSVRNDMFSLKLIGYDDEEKVGYGNISMREKQNQFIISGSQTGHIEDLKKEGYCLVTETDIDKNYVNCTGLTKASSESLTHASIYFHVKDANAVIHVHNALLWNSLLNVAPTTGKNVPYGTRDMANEITRLIDEEDLLNKKILAMAGHKDGVIAFGKDLSQAKEVLLLYYNKL